MTADSASVTFTITVKDAAGSSIVFTRVQSLSKSTQGDDGGPGEPVVREVTPITSMASTAEPYEIYFTFTYVEDEFFEAIELWMSDDNNRANAEHIADIIGKNHVVKLPESLIVTKYFWARVRDTYGNLSAWYPVSETGGYAGSTASSPDKYLALLSGSITEDELYGDLNTRINLIDTEFAWTNDIFEDDTWTGLTGLLDFVGYSQTIRDDLDNNITVTTTLQTNVENNYATTVYVDNVESNIYGASVTQFSQIQTKFNSVDSNINNKASIIQLNQAKSDIYGASVSSFTNISAEFDSVDSNITSKASKIYVDTTFVTEDEAETIASAQIAAEVDGNYAEILEFDSVKADVNAAKAQRTIKVNTHDHVVGMSMIAGGDDKSSFTIQADKFQIVRPDSTGALKTPFIVGEIDGYSIVGIDGDVIIDGSIKTKSIDTDDLFSQTITLKTNGYIKSNNYSSGTTGWQIDYFDQKQRNNNRINREWCNSRRHSGINRCEQCLYRSNPRWNSPRPE